VEHLNHNIASPTTGPQHADHQFKDSIQSADRLHNESFWVLGKDAKLGFKVARIDLSDDIDAKTYSRPMPSLKKDQIIPTV
jgi:starvation-inducible outer membrane lipoprotein